jgi:hypothetical protein
LSKEIARVIGFKELWRTVEGRWLAGLLAALAILAVFATVGSHWTDAHAMSAPDGTVRTEVAAAPYAAVSDLTLVDNMRSTSSSVQLDSSQTNPSVSRQSSSFATGMTNKSPVYGVLGSAGVNSSVASSAVSQPVHQEGNSDVAVSKATGVEYAPYALVGVLVAFAAVALNLPISRKWGINKRFGAPMHRNDKSE